jgi:hypothetical protein
MITEIDIQKMPFVLHLIDEYDRRFPKKMFNEFLERKITSLLHRITDKWFLDDPDTYHEASKYYKGKEGLLNMHFTKPEIFHQLNAISRRDPRFQLFKNLFLTQTVLESVGVLDEVVKKGLGDLAGNVTKIALHPEYQNPSKGDIYLTRHIGSDFSEVLFGRYVALEK